MFVQASRIFRHGYSTIELVVSLSVASVLTLGLGSAIFVAGKSLDLPEPSPATSVVTGQDLNRLLEAMSEAKSYSIGENQVTLNVPDRNADGADERFVYRVDEGSLIESSDITKDRIIATNIKDLNLQSSIRLAPMTADSQVRFHSQSIQDASGISVTVPYPSDCIAGDFLVAIAAIDRTDANLIIDHSWTLAGIEVGGDQVIAAWWKIVTPEESRSVTINWSESAIAIACVMRFSNVSETEPVATRGSSSGMVDANNSRVSAPALTVSHAGSIVIQAVAVQNDAFPSNATGLDAHVLCCWRQRSQLALCCSTRQMGPMTGIVDADNQYEFKKQSAYAMFGLVLKPK